jgi:hypothetical protein
MSSMVNLHTSDLSPYEVSLMLSVDANQHNSTMTSFAALSISRSLLSFPSLCPICSHFAQCFSAISDLQISS